MPAASVEVHGLTKRYRRGAIGAASLREELQHLWSRFHGRSPSPATTEFAALDAVTFSVPAGSVCGVIGRNGSGKTTLLKVLSSITLPEEGRAVLRGRVGSLLEIGAGFHGELDGIENIYLNGAILGMSRREVAHKLDDIIAFANVGAFLETPVKRYSSGMYVRLAFAIAAHLDADILLIDEVLAVGDLDFQKKCLGKMKSAASDGRTVLFVSHNLASIRQLCDIAIRLEQGRLIDSGRADGVVDRYLSRASGANVATFAKDELSARLSILESDAEIEVSHMTFNRPYRFALRLHSPRELQHAFVTLSFFSERGELVSALSSIEEGLAPFALQDMELLFWIPALPLMPGEYTSEIAIYVWGEDEPRLSFASEASHTVVAAIVNGASTAYTSEFGLVRLASHASLRTPSVKT